MPKPFAAYHREKASGNSHIIAYRVIPRYNPASAKANSDGWVYRKYALHATKGWRKV